MADVKKQNKVTTEKIGKITLDYSKYPGVDLYCDGTVEDELLEAVKDMGAEDGRKYIQSEFAEEYGTIVDKDINRIISEQGSWPFLYHLSPLRANVVDWIPMKPNAKVLEVGSGCGAITGALAKKAGELTCIDLSKKRSHINAYRHKECGNVTIRVGNFKDIEPELDIDYDYIYLIGVFEYAVGYMGTANPYEDFLAILLRHLRANGRLIIAIENKFGMKYWAGCQEDHIGKYFAGIEDYSEGGGVRTFTRNGLEKICRRVGVSSYSFYYPYPDYKFMSTIYSDDRLPQKGELSDNLRNFDRDRVLLFDEKAAFDTVIKEGLFPLYSNSYLMVIGPDLPVAYSRFSNDRAPEFAMRTDICKTQTVLGVKVTKSPCSGLSIGHVGAIEKAYHELSKRYAGSPIVMNKLTRKGNEITLEYLNGHTLEEELDGLLQRDNFAGFCAKLKEYIQYVSYGKDRSNATNLDMIFSNIIVQPDGKWQVIDYEWTFYDEIPIKFVIFRALYCYMLGSEKRMALQDKGIYGVAGIPKEDVKRYIEGEKRFQRYVTGTVNPLGLMRVFIGNQVYKLPELIGQYKEKREMAAIQIYRDTEQGFTEKNSVFLIGSPIQERENENARSYEIKDIQNCRRLRLDPGSRPCLVQILSMDIVSEKSNARCDVWGLLREAGGVACNGLVLGDKVMSFDTNDPNIIFAIEKLYENEAMKAILEKEDAVLAISLTMVELPQNLAGHIEASIVKEETTQKPSLVERLRKKMGGKQA